MTKKLRMEREMKTMLWNTGSLRSDGIRRIVAGDEYDEREGK